MKTTIALLLVAVIITSLVSVLVVLMVPTASERTEEQKTCARKFFQNSDSFVCVCNSSYCDVIHVPEVVLGEILVVTTTKDDKRFSYETIKFDTSDYEVGVVPSSEELIINTEVRYQTIKGFGGAFTDAASLNFYNLTHSTQENFLKSYFSTQGIEYNIGRIPIGSCDFSERLYTYDDVEDDFELSHFALAEEDVKYKIPFIQRAMEINSQKMTFFGSPWSAPAWMKTTNNLVGGQLKNDSEYRQSWADYFVRFIEEYEKNGIDIWAVTAQNEPDIGLREDFPFQCMGYTAQQLGSFVKNYLGPTFRDKGRTDVKIIIGDDQRVLLPDWANEAMQEEGVTDFVDGIGIHWYTNMIAPVSKLDDTHKQFPDKFLIATEACAGSVPFLEPKVDLGSWQRGQYYSKDIINNLNHWSVAWVDWNMALDLEGGPNWVKNFVDAPIIVDYQNDQFFKQPMFYHMGHFSKFIKEGSQRIEISERSESRTFKFTAVLTPEKDHVVFVVINQGDSPESKTLIDQNVGFVKITVPPNSIQTYKWPIR